MNDTFLVGIDDSECSHRAVDFATNVARSGNGRLILGYVIEWSPYTFNTPEENEIRHKRREEEVQRAKSQVLDPIATRLQAQGIQVDCVVRHGHAAHVLDGLSMEYGAAQIIVGRTGISKLRSLLFGSTPSTLVQIATVPVTVVP